jgi:hypothetical protein
MQVAVYACESNCFSLLNTNSFTLQESQFYMHKFDIASSRKSNGDLKTEFVKLAATALYLFLQLFGTTYHLELISVTGLL